MANSTTGFVTPTCRCRPRCCGARPCVCLLQRLCTECSTALEESACAPRILKPRSMGWHRGDSPISKTEAEPDSRAERDRLCEAQPDGWRGHATSTAPGLSRKQIVPLRGMGSKTSGFRHFQMEAVMQQPSFDPVKIAEREQHPPASPFQNARDAEIVEAAACKPGRSDSTGGAVAV
jgi:hypothetical protein